MPLKYEQESFGNEFEQRSGNMIAKLDDISFVSPERLLFHGLGVTINRGDIVALIGKSGVGKSTLLKIVLGRELPDKGTVTLNKKHTVSYVPQTIEDIEVDPSISIQELFYKSRGLDKLELRRAALEEAMSDPNQLDNLDKVMAEYGELLEVYQSLGGYQAESEIGRILSGLRLPTGPDSNINLETHLDEVSSGQRTRILIGQALYANADLLVLDDPTSHLDVESVAWLAGYLQNAKQTAFVATNNIPFIDLSANKVLEITDFGRALSFEGNYNQYQLKRDSLLEAERTQAASIKAERDKIEATYLKFKGEQVFKRSADMAAVGRAMQTRIERLSNEYDQAPGSKQVDRQERIPKLKFEASKRSGNDVLRLRNLTQVYGEYMALNLEHLELLVKRGEKVLVSGENGSGKSTFLRMIAAATIGGDFTPFSGEIQVGANIEAAYYAPDAVGISKEGSILEEVMKASNNPSESEAASVLSFWGFPKNSIRTKVIQQLSAGEKKQLALAKIMVQHANLLILDEPTDYLKPEVVQRLASAIEGYNGTLLIISHDPEFKSQLKFDRELLMPEGKVIVNYA